MQTKKKNIKCEEINVSLRFQKSIQITCPTRFIIVYFCNLNICNKNYLTQS